MGRSLTLPMGGVRKSSILSGLFVANPVHGPVVVNCLLNTPSSAGGTHDLTRQRC